MALGQAVGHHQKIQWPANITKKMTHWLGSTWKKKTQYSNMINPNNKTYSGLVASDDSQPENKVHFFYNSGVHLGPKQW